MLIKCRIPLAVHVQYIPFNTILSWNSVHLIQCLIQCSTSFRCCGVFHREVCSPVYSVTTVIWDYILFLMCIYVDIYCLITASYLVIYLSRATVERCTVVLNGSTTPLTWWTAVINSSDISAWQIIFAFTCSSVIKKQQTQISWHARCFLWVIDSFRWKGCVQNGKTRNGQKKTSNYC